MYQTGGGGVICNLQDYKQIENSTKEKLTKENLFS